jgi:hypothetical protein
MVTAPYMDVAMQNPTKAMDMETERACWSSLNIDIEARVCGGGEVAVSDDLGREKEAAYAGKAFSMTPNTAAAMDSHKTMQEAGLDDLKPTNDTQTR